MLVVHSDQAELDLLRILVYTLIKLSERAMDRFLAQLDKKSALYARSPLLGISRPELRQDLRCFPVRPHLVFYRPISETGGIEIVRVLHGRMNITRDMFEG